MARQICNKYKNTISKSVMLHSGSPTVYQLRPKKQKIGSLARISVGEKNCYKTNKTILLVGETGAGKSTLINTLVNYMIVKFEDNIWFEVVEREERSQSESQTSDVIVYEIFGFEDQTMPYSLTIIDTPGYGDTRGIKLDVIISQRLLDLFRSQDGIHEISAVGLVMKVSENRLSDRLRYVFDSVMSLFGRDLENNIVALMTHSDGTTPGNAIKALEAANIKCAKNEKNQPVHFTFSNCQSTPRTEEEFGLLMAWTVTARGMFLFTEFLKNSQPQRLDKTLSVLNSHIRIAACINNMQEKIKSIELKQTEIRQIQEALRKHEKEMKVNENFKVEVDEVSKVIVEISGGVSGKYFKGAVCCIVCEENCHYPGCTMALSPEDCEVMKDGCCTVCSGRCPVSDHVKVTWRYVSKIYRTTWTEKEMKAKYENNKLESRIKSSLLDDLQRQMRYLTAEKNTLLEEAYKHVMKLEQNALNVNSVSTCVHLEFLIEKMKEKGDQVKAQKLSEMRIKDKGAMEALEYLLSNIGDKAKAWGKAMLKTFKKT